MQIIIVFVVRKKDTICGKIVALVAGNKLEPYARHYPCSNGTIRAVME